MSKLRTVMAAGMAQVLCCLLAQEVFAVDADKADTNPPAPDKSTFNFFNPTPSRYMREMDPDGPGGTESPYTVDAGHFQFEMTLVDYTLDRESSGGVRQRFDAWAFAPITLKVGLLNELDAELVLEPYQIVYERKGGSRVTRRGFGDTTVRIKYNVWGNDGGSTALAVMPYVKFPTSENGLGSRGVEGGLILPMTLDLPGDFSLALTTQFDFVRNEAGRGYRPEFCNSIGLAHDLLATSWGTWSLSAPSARRATRTGRERLTRA